MCIQFQMPIFFAFVCVCVSVKTDNEKIENIPFFQVHLCAVVAAVIVIGAELSTFVASVECQSLATDTKRKNPADSVAKSVNPYLHAFRPINSS